VVERKANKPSTENFILVVPIGWEPEQVDRKPNPCSEEEEEEEEEVVT